MKALRETAGFSLYDLARRIHWSKAAVGHAETGHRLPSRELARVLDDALSANGLLVALAAAERDQGRNVSDMKRRSLLLAGIAAGTSFAAPKSQPTGRVNGSDVKRLLLRTAELRQLDDSLGGADTFALYASEMDRTRDTLSRTSHNAATRKALHAVLAEQAQLAGWAAFDAGWLERSISLYATSRTMAAEAGDPSLLANAFALEAYQHAFDGRPDVELAMASCAAVTEQVPPRVRALIFDRAAFTYASANLVRETEAALEEVAEALAGNEDDQSPDWAQWLDLQELDIMTGRCWSALRRPLRAVGPLERALATFPDQYARDKALYLLALGEAYAYGGELGLAASTIARASSLTAGVASTRPAKRIRLTLASISALKSARSG